MKLFDIFAVPVWRSGPDGKCDYFNRAWLDFTGRTLAQELGDGWTSGVHPDDAAACLRDYMHAFEARAPFVLEYRLRRHDGEYRWVDDHGAPVSDEAGKFRGYIGTCYDITDRKEAEDTLRRSEQRFSAFMDNLPAFAWMKDLEGRYVYTNKSLEQLEAFRANVIGKTDAEILPAEIAAVYRANDQQVIATKKAMQAVELYAVDEEQRALLVSKFPIFDQDGSVAMVGGAGVEITDRIQAEQALGLQELRYKTLMQTSMDSIYVIDIDGDLQEANAEFLRRRGYRVDEVKGLNVAHWNAQWTREELRERTRKLIGNSAVFETRHRCKDGSIFDVEVGITSASIAGKQLFFCVTRDITERKKLESEAALSEQRLQSFFAGASAGLCIFDGKLRYVRINETLAGMNGVPVAEHLGRSVQEVLPAIAPVLVPVLEQVLATGKPILDIELSGETPREPGVKRHWIESMFPIVGMHDRPEGVGVIAVEITASKRANEELDVANRQLQILSRRRVEIQEDERRHLSRELHDQIGQALLAVKINLQSAKRLRKRDNIVGKLTDTITLLDQILQQARQISLDLRPPVLDDLGLAPALQWILRNHAEPAGLSAEFIADPELQRLDPAVETASFRIALEALTNIIRHAQAQKISMELRRDGYTLHLIVRDDGIGFDITDHAKRADRDRLGLIGMDERTTVLGGRFECKSAPGDGTEVHAYFPMQRVKRPEFESE